jgi:hypothetical protein
MTQFMKLLLVGTITGMVMTTAAIGTAAAAEPENRITILYDAFGKDASMPIERRNPAWSDQRFLLLRSPRRCRDHRPDHFVMAITPGEAIVRYTTYVQLS